jgi:hypothetical protein
LILGNTTSGLKTGERVLRQVAATGESSMIWNGWRTYSKVELNPKWESEFFFKPE